METVTALQTLASSIPAKYDDSAFEAVANTSGFLSRLALMTGTSKVCKSGEFPINHYGIGNGTNFLDLGTAVDIVPLAWRPRALDMSGDDILSAFDPKSALFAEIMAKAPIKDSKCMFGPEFLVWVPAAKQFATLMMGSASARIEAKNIRARIGMPTTLKTQHIETKQHDWFAILTIPCTTPPVMPDMDLAAKELEKFNNPPEKATEASFEKAAETNGRER